MFKEYEDTQLAIISSQVKNIKKPETVFCFQNCSYLRWEKIVLVIKKNFLKKIWAYKNNVLEQWRVWTIFETECFFNLILEVSHI